eukprot:gene17626-12617_t
MESVVETWPPKLYHLRLRQQEAEPHYDEEFVADIGNAAGAADATLQIEVPALSPTEIGSTIGAHSSLTVGGVDSNHGSEDDSDEDEKTASERIQIQNQNRSTGAGNIQQEAEPHYDEEFVADIGNAAGAADATLQIEVPALSPTEIGSTIGAHSSLIAGGDDTRVDAPSTDGDDVDDMSVGDLRVSVRQLRAENTQLRAENTQLRAENTQLRAIIFTLQVGQTASEGRIAHLESLLNV